MHIKLLLLIVQMIRTADTLMKNRAAFADAHSEPMESMSKPRCGHDRGKDSEHCPHHHKHRNE